MQTDWTQANHEKHSADLDLNRSIGRRGPLCVAILILFVFQRFSVSDLASSVDPEKVMRYARRLVRV